MNPLYLRLLSYVRPYWRVFMAALAGTLVLGLTEPMLAALLKPLLDNSFVDKDPTFIRWMPLALAGLFVVRGLADFISSVGMNWVAYRVVSDLRDQMFDQLLNLPMARFDEQSSATLLSRLTYDVTQVMSACTQALVTLLRDSITVAGLLLYMFWLNWQLSLVALLVAPAVAITVRSISQRLRRLSRRLQGGMGELNQVIDEAIQGQREIKIFGAAEYERQRFAKANQNVRRLNLKLSVATEASTHFVQFLTVSALALVIYWAAQMSAQQNLSVGGFVSLFGAMALLLTPVKRLTKLNEQLQRGLAAAESVFSLLDQEREIDHGQCSIQRAKGDVAFSELGFHYPGQDRTVLESINLEVRAGETIALVGASGSGKTTLMALLPRLYEPQIGKIYLDGQDISQYSLDALRAQIAYVGQNVVLFNDTLRANIAYGNLNQADDTAIQRAAELANAWEFIHQLPHGLDTLIGENGMRLSGGQRQRIAIARALLKDAPILILDEATSALDNHSERQVQAALETLRHGRTSFIIAHRLSTIEQANRIVVLQQGHIVEVGNHVELLAKNGIYAHLQRLNQVDAH